MTYHTSLFTHTLDYTNPKEGRGGRGIVDIVNLDNVYTTCVTTHGNPIKIRNGEYELHDPGHDKILEFTY